MADRPNILFLMTDQMQGRVLDPAHPCRTPNFDRLAARGVRFRNAHTVNAVCSPARASLMTGLLPHNHGVLTVTHTKDRDQCVLRTDKPHWAQRLSAAGYRTAYFGKWHVEHTNRPQDFGWQLTTYGPPPQKPAGQPRYSLGVTLDEPEGYKPAMLYGVTDRPPEQRGVGINSAAAKAFLEDATKSRQPWCCFVSVTEPHDPYICGEEAYAQYDPDALPLPPSLHDDLAGRPGIYRKAGRAFAQLTERQHREAAACYYASVTEIDALYGQLLDVLQRSGQADNTLVILTSDHGDCLGAHGLYQKNFSAVEEIYSIPMIVAGPGIARGVATPARVGSHDLCPTILELTGCEPITVPDSRSFAPVLRDPTRHEAAFTTGYAEYFGTRYMLTQRVIWEGPWKLVWNGFDFDELYNLDADPHEMRNLIDDPACRPVVRRLMELAWQKVRSTRDHTLLQSGYASLRVAPFGPGILA